MHLFVKNNRLGGFSLPDVLFASFVVSFVVLVGLGSMSLSQITRTKAEDEAIGLDFLVHYLETLKGLPFDDLRPALPINPLYNGAGGAPNIRIPGDATAFSVNNTNYLAFHPELAGMLSLNPMLSVTYSAQSSGGVDQSKHIEAVLSWDAPLGRGTRHSVRLNLVRVKDL